MGCILKHDYECVTKVGDTFRGQTFSFDSADVIGVEVIFTDKYGNVEDELSYSEANNTLLKTDVTTWMMINRKPLVEPGVYYYQVKATLVDGSVDTFLEGTKKFE